jgi:hypothetical protein
MSDVTFAGSTPRPAPILVGKVLPKARRRAEFDLGSRRRTWVPAAVAAASKTKRTQEIGQNQLVKIHA